jgi:beta-galactosidase
MVHIAGRRFNPRTTETIDIKAYSNQATLELRVNGQSLGAAASVQGHVFVWPGIQLVPGENQVEVLAKTPGDALLTQDAVVWTRQ